MIESIVVVLGKKTKINNNVDGKEKPDMKIKIQKIDHYIHKHMLIPFLNIGHTKWVIQRLVYGRNERLYF